jgi:hypothetical protein
VAQDFDEYRRKELVAARERIKELESALARFADGDLWGHDGYWHQWHGSDDPREFARAALQKP